MEDGANGGDICLIRCLDAGLEEAKRSGKMNYIYIFFSLRLLKFVIA